MVLITIQIQQVFKQTTFTIVCYYIQSLSHFGFMGVIVASNTQKTSHIIFYSARILDNLNSFEPNVKNESNHASSTHECNDFLQLDSHITKEYKD
jgi:hypothetical protein